MTSILRRLWASMSGRIGLVLLAFVLVLLVLSQFRIGVTDPLAQDTTASFTSPRAGHPFGTDQFGRDILSRVLSGMSHSLGISVLAVALACIVGVTFGVFAGFIGGWVDEVVSRLSDLLFAFPAVLLALAIVSALGPGEVHTSLAIAIVYVPIFVRTTRGPVLSLREREFVKAATLLAYPRWRIMSRHILPNLAAPVFVQVALALSWGVLTESGLSFLGLGTQPPNPSLGLMVSDSQAVASLAWWTMAFPSLFIVILVVTFNMLGDGLRDALDPSLNRGA